VNPEAWRKLKYFLEVDVEELLPLSVKAAQAMALQSQAQGQTGQPMNQNQGLQGLQKVGVGG